MSAPTGLTGVAAATTEAIRSSEWYRKAVIYELHIRAFSDSDGDGIGDLNGLTAKLDYLQELGVTAIWLLPFYPSPNRDGGYDIADFRTINPVYGDLRGFRRFLRAAHDRGIHVITELVLNHTSDQHPWFQRARRAPAGSRWRDYYVWSDTPELYRDARIIFKDFETSNWTWDPIADAYFWHRFYSHQPDLNYESPDVIEEVFGIVDFWMDMGVDGVRLDAVPYLFERDGTNCENLPETHVFLKRLRAHIDQKYDNRLLLAEANQWPEDAAAYFGDGDECHMNFHFPLMPRLFMSLRQENRLPIIDILEQTPALPSGCEWATFLRNHDELTLEMVTDEERDYMYRSYGADPQMRLNLGIRRRLAPLLGNDRRKFELLYSLLFSLPGTPVVYYGDEIGMGDNVYLGDRDGVRTPMQWSPDRNAGFSTASTQRLYLPPIADGAFHYQTVNVENQRADNGSLLSWMRQIIAVRQRNPVLASNEITFPDPDNHRVLAYIRRAPGEHPFLVVANLSQRAQSVDIDLRELEGSIPIEVFGRTPFAPITDKPYTLTLAPYGYFWFEVVAQDASRLTGEAWIPPTVAMEWPESLLDGTPRVVSLVQRWMRHRRWYASKSRAVSRVSLHDTASIPGRNGQPIYFCAMRVEFVDGDPETYDVPLTVVDAERTRAICAANPDAVVLFLDDGRALIDALADEDSMLAIASALMIKRTTGPLLSEPYPDLRNGLRAAEPAFARPLGAEQSNSSVIVNDRVLIKVMRRLHEGENPDLEVSRHLRSVDFRAGARLLGALSWKANGDAATLATAYEFVPSDGDGWTHALDSIDLFLQSSMVSDLAHPPPSPPVFAGMDADQCAVFGTFGPEMTLLGQRTAELHLALAEGDDPAFRPEPFSVHYQRSIYQGLRTGLQSSLRALRAHRPRLDGATAALADVVLSGRDVLLGRAAAVSEVPIEALRIRTHGDFHLGQVLFTGRDFVIIDFEGEPASSTSERRIKRPPLRDIAGMLRSFDYASQVALSQRRERGLPPLAGAALGDDESAAWSRWWRDAASAAFVAGYLATPGIDRLLPRTERATDVLLGAFVLEKALYELRYELDNRPAWVHLPLSVLAEVAQAGSLR